MKQKLKFILSSFTLLLFALLAGGSFDDIVAMFWILIGVLVIVAVAAIIQNIVQSKNKEKRLQMIKQDESSSDDFDRSISFGNDRCMFYFDSSKKKVMIMRVMTEGIKKSFVYDFDFCGKDLCRQNDPYFCIYDDVNRHILCGHYENMDVIFENKDLVSYDKNNDITPNNSIRSKLLGLQINNAQSSNGTLLDYVYTLVDECHGLIAIIRKGKVSSVFNYINRNYLLKKTGDKSYINDVVIGSYNFIMDDFFNVLVIITPSSYELFNYSDIIEVSYEENGTQLYSKSAMRTVGGAIVGGALMGGAGAVVGGLSGASKKNMEVNTMNIKILLRSTQRSACVLSFNDSKRILKTKDASDNSLYQNYQKNANKAKDLLSVIIDKAKQNVSFVQQNQVQNSTGSQHSSVADELAKLAKLKSDGILTEDEFKVQKDKLLNS